MKIIPSIDLKDGKCVKLVRGKPGSGRIITDNPVEAALEWERRGAETLHVVDLDAALGRGSNRQVILEILGRIRIPVQVGGGIRSFEEASDLLDAGARWVIFGTAAYERPEEVLRTVEAYGRGRVMVALDSFKGRILVRGWTGEASTTLSEALKFYEKHIYAFLYTDVEVEGTLAGVRLEKVRRVVGASARPIIYAGGVSSLEDLKGLQSVGVYGVVVGKALYDGKFSFEEALKIGKRTQG